MNVSTFDFLERKLTGGSKILFNLGNGAISVFPRVCVFVGGTTENLY